MLLDSPRLTDADRAAWARLERYDDMIAATGHVDTLAQRAMDVIAAFIEGRRCYVSTSWGKDSTVVVDLAGRLHLPLVVVWVRVDGYDLPECEAVRDQVLARHPHLVYDEHTIPPAKGRWWDDDGPRSASQAGGTSPTWRRVAARYGAHITGIRAEESRIRRLIHARDGDASTNACRPIGRWDATDVFAYLAHRRLPVHPAYAMSLGGHHDRRWLRVHSLGGVTGADRGRSEWESRYYGDVITQSRLRDHAMARMPRAKHDALPASVLVADAPPLHDRTAHPTVADMHHALERMETAGLVGRTDRKGRTRWYRTVDWPPEPRWLRPADVDPLAQEVITW